MAIYVGSSVGHHCTLGLREQIYAGTLCDRASYLNIAVFDLVFFFPNVEW